MHANVKGIEKSLQREQDDTVAYIGSIDTVQAESLKLILLSCERRGKERTMGRPLPC